MGSIKKLNKYYNYLKTKMLNTNSYEKKYEIIRILCKFLYNYNLVFYDEIIEKEVRNISNIINENTPKKVSNKLVFFDSFGLSHRGLLEIYMDAFTSDIFSKYNVTYITYTDNYDSTEYIRNKYKNKVEYQYINNDFSSYEKLYEIMNDAEKIFFYINPWDILPLFVSCKCSAKKFFVNLTDDAFWVGANFADYYLDFRDVGVVINKKYRLIDDNKILLQPFYPNIKETEFQGYPYEKMNKQNTIFSGGALYKTIDSTLCYYKMIDEILNSNQELYFWYAGRGNDKYLKQLALKYNNRVFHTSERKDLFEVLKNVRLFINTYPITGGLMSQFAVKAGVPSITIIKDDINKGILLDTGEKVFEYDSVDRAIEDTLKLCNDDSYYEERIKNITECIVSESRFQRNLLSIIEKNESEFPKKDIKLEIDDFLKSYIERDTLFLRCNSFINKKYVLFTKFWYYYVIYLFIKKN